MPDLRVSQPVPLVDEAQSNLKAPGGEMADKLISLPPCQERA